MGPRMWPRLWVWALMLKQNFFFMIEKDGKGHIKAQEAKSINLPHE